MEEASANETGQRRGRDGRLTVVKKQQALRALYGGLPVPNTNRQSHWPVDVLAKDERTHDAATVIGALSGRLCRVRA